MRGGEDENLVDQKVDVAVTVRFAHDVTVFLRRYLAGRVQKSRNAVLLHDCHVLLLQTEIVVLLQELDRAGDEVRGGSTHCWFHHSS